MATAPFYTRTHPAEIADPLPDDRGSRRDCPLYAYDLPVSVHSKLTADLLLELAAEGVLAGLKDSSGDDGGLREVILRRRERDLPAFSVLTGSELTVDSALWMGADGVVPGLGNVDPHGYVRLYQAASGGDWGRPRARAGAAVSALFQHRARRRPPGWAAAPRRSARSRPRCFLRGVIDHPATALPQIPLDDDDIARVKAHLSDAALI